LKKAFGKEVLDSVALIANKHESKWEDGDQGIAVKNAKAWLEDNGYGHIPMVVVDVAQDP